MAEDPFSAIAEKLSLQRRDIEQRIAEITEAQTETERLLELVQKLSERLTPPSRDGK